MRFVFWFEINFNLHVTVLNLNTFVVRWVSSEKFGFAKNIESIHNTAFLGCSVVGNFHQSLLWKKWCFQASFQLTFDNLNLFLLRSYPSLEKTFDESVQNEWHSYICHVVIELLLDRTLALSIWCTIYEHLCSNIVCVSFKFRC